jgi:hypothetical protein
MFVKAPQCNIIVLNATKFYLDMPDQRDLQLYEP